MNASDIIALIIALALPQAAGGIGAIFSARNIRPWYDKMRQPWFAPPNWVFGPVWTILYLLMGLASYLVWLRGWDTPGVQLALILYAVQLVLNALWSYLFFGRRNPRLAFYEILVLWCAIEATNWAFMPVSYVSLLLMIPYGLWVSFACYLNYSIWKLNTNE